MPPGPDDVTMNGIARELGVTTPTVHYWVQQGWVTVLRRPERHGQKMLLDRASVEACFKERARKDPRHSKKGRRNALPTRPHPPPHQTPSSRYTSTSPSTATAQWSCADLVQEHLNEYDAPDKPASTLRNKRRALLPFAQLVPTMPCTHAQVVEYLKSMHFDADTRHMYFRQVRTFLYWAEEIHHIPPPSLRRLAPKLEEEEYDTFTLEEAQRFLAAASSYRERLMYECMFMTGMRPGGVGTVGRKDVHPNHLVSREKTGKVEHKITPEMAQRLLALGSDPIFVDQNGRPLTKDGVGSRIRKTCYRAGIVKRHMGGNLLRHTAGTLVYEQSGSLGAVQDLLGHKTLAVARIYARTTDKRRQLSFDEYNPLAYVQNGGKP